MKSFFLSLILICTAFAAAPAAASTGPVDSGHVVLELIPGSEAAAPGSTTYVALKQTIDKGWHTYWRNPGDSGEATTIGWTLPQGWRAGNIVWATPRKLPVGPLMNYGYENEVVLPVPLTVPATARPGQTMRLKAEVALLVCELLCVPESAHLELDVPVVAGQAAPHPKWGAAVALALGRAPKPTNLTATFRREGDALRLSVAGEKLSSAKANDAYFFAFDGTAVKAASPQTVERGTNGLTLSLAPGESLEGGETLKTLAGVLTTDGRAYEITAVPGAPVKGAFGLGAPSSESGGGGGLGLPLAIAFAFAGGLILNLMPCVFPVLSMKAASLAAHAHGGEARRQGLAFTAGVLAAFLALAVVLIAARAAGGAAGWGFQLQSPGVVAALALLMLAIALNLSGVFEAGTSLQRAGGIGAGRSDLAGSALTGALAVVVAAPCTAPFMAGALGYAMTQSAALGLLVFAALGLGFAAPFLALSFSPALLQRLPRPGPWMDGLRKLLAFPMYGAAAWLAWVLSVQAGSNALAALMAAGVSLALAGWLFGVFQRGHGGYAAPAMAGLAALAAVGLAAGGARTAVAGPTAAGKASALPSQPWSPERVAVLRAEGKPVFVNFTAAWCVTCQVNEQVAFSTRPVADAFAKTGAVYLKADWTRRDPVIARALAEHGRAGVPLYLVYGKNPAAPPQVLPQLLTGGAVVAAINRAAA